ncbi:protein deltex isoform X2 [Pectinophora gossypiella]|uniref:protein deltex isoform X2 n=1 Tax=Pectinophora gossypiella TaxID=13191 RepID=UPI00214E8568|nr:protein deltex isoform X2 [Pectinophora gossypiella]
MSAVHCVVVWEAWRGTGWIPHAPGVARTLERAHAKKLTRVVLADADPALRGHYVNLRTLTQYADTPDGGTEECPVRRACYSVQSPAGRGVRWEWARLSPHHQLELEYDPLPMEVQCLLEETWQRGGDSASWDGWTLAVRRGVARRGAAARAVRRAPQPPYPLARPPAAAPPAPPTPPARTPQEGRRPRIPQQHTGSSVHSVQSVQSVQSAQSAQSVQSVQSAPARAGARSASPRERKPGLARQILHNLNIFSNKTGAEKLRDDSGDSAAGPDAEPSTDGGSTRSTRRHSVDTVSTYLSHESKDSLQQASVGSLLNCSAGSDDVFEAAPPPPPLEPPAPADSDNDLVEEGGGAVVAWVRSVQVAQWGAVCPMAGCLRPLDAARAPVVALARCQHLLHLHCLNEQLERLQRAGRPLHVECRVCGSVYGREPPAPAPGDQPPGSMAWRLEPTPLPQHDVPTILVTYNFQSGRQGPSHPVPGAPYYAVGFPRYTLLPDNALGRQVLSALRAAWSSARLFCVCASQTTGREHVVAWRAPPPPHRAHHYAAPACAERLLRAALARLAALLPP